MIKIDDDEVWRPYPEFPFVDGSTIGRIRTTDRYVKTKNGKRLIKGRILKQHRMKNGYMEVPLSVDGKTIHILIHRIIASCFLTNPDGFEQINHKNCIRDDNRLSNLEWCSREYNMQYREKHGKSQGKLLFAISLKTEKISRFQSQMEASRELDVNSGNICNVIKGRCKQTGDFWFTYADENAVENARIKFGDKVAYEVEKLMNKKIS